MDKENKIISFEKRKNNRKKKEELKLTAKIAVYICRKDEKYYIDWYSPDEKLSQEDIFLIQQRILSRLIEDVEELEFKKREFYEVEFTLLYYENTRDNFTYICVPQDIDKKKLTEYLFVSTQIYELKKAGRI